MYILFHNFKSFIILTTLKKFKTVLLSRKGWSTEKKNELDLKLLIPTATLYVNMYIPIFVDIPQSMLKKSTENWADWQTGRQMARKL